MLSNQKYSGRSACLIAAVSLSLLGGLAGAAAPDDLNRLAKDRQADLARMQQNLQGDKQRIGGNIKEMQDAPKNWQSELGQDFQIWSNELGKDVGAWQIVGRRAQGDYLMPTLGTTSAVDYVTVQGLARRYLIIRNSEPKPNAPLVIMMHAHGLSPEKMGNLTRAGRLAFAFGVVMILPEAVNEAWNQDPSANKGADDVAFISALIDRAIAQYGVNPKRVYAEGYSSGGFMAARLGCELSSKIAGIGEVAATMRGSMKQICAPARTVPTAVIAGTADTVVPYNGIFEALQSAPDTLSMWSNLAKCTGEIVTTHIDNDTDNTAITLERHEGGTGGAEMRLYTVIDGGHTWPGSPYAAYTLGLGRTSRDIDATLELWSFFSQYSLP